MGSGSVWIVGVPVVDKLSPTDTLVVLRSKDRTDAWNKIRKLQKQMSVRDLIRVFEIGQRPDKPVPVSKHFCEVDILPGKAQGYVMCNLVWGWCQAVTGLKDYEMRR